jgi:quercetin dioxygenase-like cupin family protein
VPCDSLRDEQEKFMSPVHRTLSNSVLVFDLADEMRVVRSQLDAGQSRIARTLVKEGSLRLTLIGVRAGGEMHEHVAQGPITIHALEGKIIVRTEREARTLPAGGLMALAGGVRHDVSSNEGGLFLLTLIAAGAPDPTG